MVTGSLTRIRLTYDIKTDWTSGDVVLRQHGLVSGVARSMFSETHIWYLVFGIWCWFGSESSEVLRVLRVVRVV